MQELDLDQTYDIHEMYQLLDSYFNNFQNKDIASLEKMFSETVTLRDWEVDVKGIDRVLKANQNIFSNTGEIKITRKSTVVHESGLTFSEILIDVNNEQLKVLDVITFNNDNKITSIRAYKG